MENDQEKLREYIALLRKELEHVRQMLQESNSVIRECRKGFETISQTGNTRVADVFLEGMDEDGVDEE